MAKELPSRVRQFIHTHVKSLEQLEVLLLLRASPGQEWTAAAIYDEIRSNPESIERRLAQMATQGLVGVGGDCPRSYRYQPATPELDAAVQELAVLYREFRVTIVEEIFSEPISPIRGFADAFRLRKDN